MARLTISCLHFQVYDQLTMRRHSLVFVTALVLVFTLMEADAGAKVPLQSSAITNNGIRWDGDWIGLNAFIEGKSEKQALQDHKKIPNSELVKLLADKDRWVAAHVLLTYRANLEYKRSASKWNGLKVSLYADGTVGIDQEQQHEIKRFWKKQILGITRKNR